jgi:hypothetical protein
VDEKRSGRPSILRKVQKMVFSKSLHKRGRNISYQADYFYLMVRIRPVILEKLQKEDL